MSPVRVRVSSSALAHPRWRGCRRRCFSSWRGLGHTPLRTVWLGFESGRGGFGHGRRRVARSSDQRPSGPACQGRGFLARV